MRDRQIAANKQFLDKEARHDSSARAGIVSEQKAEGLTWQHLAVQEGYLMRQWVHPRASPRQDRINSGP